MKDIVTETWIDGFIYECAYGKYYLHIQKVTDLVVGLFMSISYYAKVTYPAEVYHASW